MRLTAESQHIIAQNQRKGFCEKGADILQRLFPDVIEFRHIPRQALLETVEECYQWTEERLRPSQLLAVRLACAKLCLGTFFMDDSRHDELRMLIEAQRETTHLTDDDPIYRYLQQHKALWSEDHFIRHLALSQDLARCIPSDRIDYQDWMNTLLEADEPLSAPRREQQTALFRQLTQIAWNALPELDERMRFLLGIAQFYEGIYCFDDPLRPRWYRCIVRENPEMTRYRILKNFNAI